MVTALMAGRLLDAGRAAVHACKGDAVAMISLREDQEAADVDELALLPGSFGIRRVLFPQGKYFEHRKTWDEELSQNQSVTNTQSQHVNAHQGYV